MHVLRTPREAAEWLRSRVSGEVHCDSRKVGAGDGFIAWPGAATDGRQFVPTALQQGAKACLVEFAGSEAYGFTSDAVVAYEGLKAATGPNGSIYYGAPRKGIDVLAVTGTNGKTSTAWWLAQALSHLDPQPVPCGMVGTLGIGRPPHVEHTGLTTPDPVLMQRHLRQFVQQGDRACAIEASSIGIVERRLDGTRLRVAAFTNFTQDHLDYHGSMEAYWAAKAELFRWPGLQAPQHTVLFDRDSLLRAIRKSGFEVIDYLPYGAFPAYFYLFTGVAFRLLKGRGLNLDRAIVPYFIGQLLALPITMLERRLNLAMQTVICRRLA